MATPAKPKKSGKKIIDVTHKTDAASGNSRSIIVNREVVKDPMMAEVSQLTDQAAGAKPADSQPEPQPKSQAAGPVSGPPELSRHKKIEPIMHDNEEPASTEPVAANTKGRTIKPPAEAETPAAVTADSPVPPAEPVAETVTAPSAESAAAPVPDKAAPADTADVVGDTEPSKPDESPVETGDASSDVAQPGRSFDESAVPSSDGSDTLNITADQDQDAPKPARTDQLSSDLSKAIETGEYFLPIRTAESRRAHRAITLGVLLVVILAAVWVDVALDANIISLGSLQPLTNFF